MNRRFFHFLFLFRTFALKTALVLRKMSNFAKNTAHNERRFKINAYLCSVNILNTINIMEKIKRTREEVRAAFREYMREKRQEDEAAQDRLKLFHQKWVAGLV